MANYNVIGIVKADDGSTKELAVATTTSKFTVRVGDTYAPFRSGRTPITIKGFILLEDGWRVHTTPKLGHARTADEARRHKAATRLIQVASLITNYTIPSEPLPKTESKESKAAPSKEQPSLAELTAGVEALAGTLTAVADTLGSNTDTLNEIRRGLEAVQSTATAIHSAVTRIEEAVTTLTKALG